MNKKGQTGTGVFFGIMIAVMLWVAFSQTLDPIKDATTSARGVDQLDCGNGSISIGTKSTCVIVDWAQFGYAGTIITVIIGAAGGGILGKIVESRRQ